MVTGWMLFTGNRYKGRRLLYIKKKHAYYLLPQHREFAITLWKHAEINAISISIILGISCFIRLRAQCCWPLLLYAVALLIMNKNYFHPCIVQVGNISHGVRRHRDQEAATDSLRCCFCSSVSGLFLCLVFRTDANTIEAMTAAAGGCIALFVGLRQLYQLKKGQESEVKIYDGRNNLQN